MGRYINLKLVLLLGWISYFVMTPHLYSKRSPVYSDHRPGPGTGRHKEKMKIPSVHTVPYSGSPTVTAIKPKNNSAFFPAAPFPVFQTKEYITYNELKDESRALNEEALKHFKLADGMKKAAMEKQDDATFLVDYSKSLTDADKKEEMLSRADLLTEMALDLLERSDAIRELGRNSIAASDSKRIEAELYIQSGDQTRYEQILALYPTFSSGTPETVITKTGPLKRELKIRIVPMEKR